MALAVKEKRIAAPARHGYSRLSAMCVDRAEPIAEGAAMSVDAATVKRVARLARIALPEDDVPKMQEEINAMLGFVAQLDELDVTGVEAMTSVMPMAMKKRDDVVTDGEIADVILANAPASEDHYFMVPKVIE
jgi:aspartyl-tRNA(Asn)/glutamyl-tRNA(Gln) amidotransferase subunit C